MLCALVCLHSYNINWAAFCNHDLDDISNEMVGIYSAILLTIAGTIKFVFFANLSIVGMNVSLMWNSVGFYQVKRVTEFFDFQC